VTRQTPTLDLAEIEAVKEMRAALRAELEAHRVVTTPHLSPDAHHRARVALQKACARIIAARLDLEQALLASEDRT